MGKNSEKNETWIKFHDETYLDDNEKQFWTTNKDFFLNASGMTFTPQYKPYSEQSKALEVIVWADENRINPNTAKNIIKKISDLRDPFSRKIVAKHIANLDEYYLFKPYIQKYLPDNYYSMVVRNSEYNGLFNVAKRVTDNYYTVILFTVIVLAIVSFRERILASRTMKSISKLFSKKKRSKK